MSLMPDLSRRAALRLGVSTFAGATGVWALSALVDPIAVPAMPSPLDPDQPAAPPAATGRRSTADPRVGLVHLGGPRRCADELDHRPAAWPDRAVASGDRAARSARKCQAGHEFRRRTGAGRAGQSGPAAVRRGRGRRRRQLLASTGRRRGRRVDGAQRTDPDAAGDGSGYLADRLHRLVDGRLRRDAAGLAAGPGAHRRDLRGQPGAVSVVHRQHDRGVRQLRRLDARTRSSDCLRCPEFRCGWTAATTTSSARPPTSSSLSCTSRPRVDSPPGGHDEAYWRQQLPGELAWLAS